MSDLMELEKIADLADKEPGVYEGTFGDIIYTVTVGKTGVHTTTRWGKAVPPPGDDWKAVKEISRLAPEEGITQIRYSAQSLATAMRLRCTWTVGTMLDEYEPIALVRRKGVDALWNDLLFLLVLRNGNARYRTGVGVVMDLKATAERRWKPEVGRRYALDAWIDLDGTAVLWIDNELQFMTPRPAKGKPGPWEFPLMVQLGGPTGKAGGGHVFSDVVLEVREEA